MTNKIVIYKFELELETPLRIGGDDNSVLKDRTGNPLIFGSSIAGAIRNYFQSRDFDTNEAILDFMGGAKTEEKDKVKFIESKAIIEDGKIEQNASLGTKEGTQIDSSFGTAKQKMKYEYEYIKPGTTLSFTIEYELNEKEDKKDIDKIMQTIAHGFETKELKLGGQKNNDFGSFKVRALKKATFNLSTVNDIENHIKYKAGIEELKVEDKEVTVEDIWVKNCDIYKINDASKNLMIELKGKFPYGVYQNFKIKDSEKGFTGIENDTIPASSIKGLLRHQIEKMMNQIQSDKIVQEKMEILFGGEESAGLIHCFDIKDIKDENKVQSIDKDNNGVCENDPSHIKINRLTGGNMDHALLTQRENSGENLSIKVELKKSRTDDNSISESAIFPLLYTMVSIANGELPIGGKTNIGLGVFKATEINIEDQNLKDLVFMSELEDGNKRFDLNKEEIQSYFEKFLAYVKIKKEEVK